MANVMSRKMGIREDYCKNIIVSKQFGHKNGETAVSCYFGHTVTTKHQLMFIGLCLKAFHRKCFLSHAFLGKLTLASPGGGHN